MKKLILASAAMLTFGLGSAFAATNDTAQQNQPQVAMNAQTNGSQTGTYYTQSFTTPAGHPYVGGWQPAPAGTNPVANGY